MLTIEKQKYLQGVLITLALLIFAACGSKEQKQPKDVVREQTKKTSISKLFLRRLVFIGMATSMSAQPKDLKDN